VVLSIVTIGLMVVVIIGVVYSVSGQSPHRRRIGQQAAMLALSANLLIDAITRPERRWLNVGVAGFVVGAMVFQVVWDRRRKVDTANRRGSAL
jgi:MFS superfamily sulfate permease-like transporter